METAIFIGVLGIQASLLALIFMLLQLLKLIKLTNKTVMETAKQVNIIDRNTYPKSNSKKYQ